MFSHSEIQASGKKLKEYRVVDCGAVWFCMVLCGAVWCVFNYLKTVVRSVAGVGTELFNISN